MVEKLAALALDPRPRGAEKLAEVHSLYRIRVGDHRAVYAVDDASAQVIVAGIFHRRLDYDDLPALERVARRLLDEPPPG